MGSIIKFFVFLLGLVGLSASKKRKEEVKKIDKKVKQNTMVNSEVKIRLVEFGIWMKMKLN